MASVGIHSLVLGFALPNYQSWSTETPSTAPRDVSVIELTEAEQARLPDLSPPPVDVPALPDAAVGDLPITDFNAIEPSVSAPLTSLPPLPSLPPLTLNNRLPIALAPRSLPLAPPPSSQSRLPAPPANTLLPQSPNAADSVIRPDFDPLRDPIPADELINRKSDPPELAANSTAAEQALQEQVNASGLRYDPSNTTERDVAVNSARWMVQTGARKSNTESLTLAGAYPRAACDGQLQGTSVFGVSVDAQGNVTPNPAKIRGSGYSFLDNQALQQIRSYRFPNTTGSPKHYTVSVPFQFDANNCPAVARTQPTQPNETSTPKPTESPAARRTAPAPQSAPLTPQPAVNPSVAPTKTRLAPPEPSPSPETTQPAPQPQELPAAIITPPQAAPSPVPEASTPAPVSQNAPPAPPASIKEQQAPSESPSASPSPDTNAAGE